MQRTIPDVVQSRSAVVAVAAIEIFPLDGIVAVETRRLTVGAVAVALSDYAFGVDQRRDVPIGVVQGIEALVDGAVGFDRGVAGERRVVAVAAMIVGVDGEWVIKVRRRERP